MWARIKAYLRMVSISNAVIAFYMFVVITFPHRRPCLDDILWNRLDETMIVTALSLIHVVVLSKMK